MTGVEVTTLDGAVTYSEASGFRIGDDGALVVLDGLSVEVARFEVGNWLNATRLDALS